MSTRAALELTGGVPAEAGAPAASPARRLRLLVVDDDAVDRLAVRRAVRQAGIDAAVEEAEDGAEALGAVRAAAAAGAPFDCVLLDYQMPGTTGLEVLRALRGGAGGTPHAGAPNANVPNEHAPAADVPVVMLTGQSDPETAVALIKAGAADFLPKGALTADRLVRVVGGAVRVAIAERARRAAEAAMRRALADAEAARARAEEANRAKSEFLAMMSHELRTPLNAIGGYVQLMQMGVPEPVAPAHQDYLDRLRRSQQHLLSLINSVLNYAKLEAGRVTFDLAAVPAAELVAAVEPLVAPLAAAKGLAYSARVAAGPGGAPLVARADREKALQVLLNLVANAVKFTPAGGRVAVTAEALAVGAPGAGSPDTRSPNAASPNAASPNAEPPAGVALRVADTGVGIAAEKLGAVFDPFVQVDAGYARQQEGTGLGLAISRELARGMGGDQTAESAPGAGSVFTFVLPGA